MSTSGTPTPNGANAVPETVVPKTSKAPIEPHVNGTGAAVGQGKVGNNGTTETVGSSTHGKSKSKRERFPWESIGGFNEGKKFDKSFIANSHAIKTFVAETFSGDWYWNTGIVIGVCFFSWLVAKWRFSIFGLIFVLLSASSVYRAEYRRFERNVRDDIQRIAAAERLEDNFESMEWLNSFLAKFWVIYMPALSETVLAIAHEQLKDMAPGYGIDALSLDEFTLGTKAPRIDSVKSFTKKGKNIVEWNWEFSFTPNDTSDMTKKEIEKKIDPKVALGVRVGKAMVSKNLPILVEDMSVSGRMKITLNLSLNFPHIKIVSISLLEPPKMDFSLKPVGGDTFGLDVMSLIPGLSSLITTIVNSNAGPILYAPNHLDIDVEELMEAQNNDAIGVVAVTMKSPEGLKDTINPYVQISTDSDPSKYVRTEVQAKTKNPRWNDTKYILVSSLQQKIHFDVYNFRLSKKKGELYGSAEFELDQLLQKDAHHDLSSSLEIAGKKKGSLNYDVRWFPTIQSETSSVDDDSKDVDIPDSEVGIFKFTLHQAKGLDNTVSVTGMLNPSAELYINDKLINTYRTLKNANEPSWEESTEFLVTEKASTKVKLIIKDNSSKKGAIIGTLEESLDTLVFNASDGNDVFALSPAGELRLTSVWKPVSLSGVSAGANYVPPIGVVRLHLRDGVDLVNLETIGKVDPYAKILLNNRLKYQTGFHPDTCDPNFNEVIYLPIISPSQHLSIELMDDQNVGKDRPLGACNIAVSEFVKKGENNTYMFVKGDDKIISSQLQRKDKKPEGVINYSISFIPSIPVYSITELEELKDKEAKYAAKQKERAVQLEEWEALYEKNKEELEWVEVEDTDDFDIAKKEKMSLDQLLTYRSGTLGIQIVGGKVTKADTYIQVVVDDRGSPSFVSARTNGRQVNPEVGDAFIRDLPNSKLIFRSTKKQQVKSSDQILAEHSFQTIDLLQKCFDKAQVISVGDARLEVRFEYIPSAIKLPPSETILDTGRAKVEFIGAENLASADRNGKSDPYLTVELEKIELFRTKTVKKNLNPVWNETTTLPVPSRSRCDLKVNVYDWDRAGKNELIGSGRFDISQIRVEARESVTFQLEPQGVVNARVTFIPEYMHRKVGEKEFGIGLASLAGAPLKGVEGVANLATGGVGAAVSGAGMVGSGVGHVGKGGASLFKSVLGGKKSKKSMDTSRSSMDRGSSTRPSIDNTNGDVRSQKSGLSKSKSTGTGAGAAGTAGAGDIGHERTSSEESTFSTAAKGKKTTEGTLIIHSGTNLGKEAQLKASIAINGKLKEFYHTKNVKASNGAIRWDEETKFDAPKDAEIVFGGVVHHTFSKDQELGNAKIKLSEVIDSPRDITLDLGTGQIIVSFRYSPEPEDSGSESPVPEGW
ncbi:Tricalbin-3 [Cyberlindnera fabianii]|uniref:Tricalbin-3 n=1 Tax=Cyberlindnera fabianii TaxID=36022 RepID=A0A1V2LEL5_CYBFA|nr:Tricalbin-3 [Cyberlindnera fabianii]